MSLTFTIFMLLIVRLSLRDLAYLLISGHTFLLDCKGLMLHNACSAYHERFGANKPSKP